MEDLKTVADLQEIQAELLHIFPSSIRASEADSMWFGKGRKRLVLTCSFCTDTVYAYIVQIKGSMIYFVDYDSNNGYVYQFAESSVEDFIKRMLVKFYGQLYKN